MSAKTISLDSRGPLVVVFAGKLEFCAHDIKMYIHQQSACGLRKRGLREARQLSKCERNGVSAVPTTRALNLVDFPQLFPSSRVAKGRARNEKKVGDVQETRCCYEKTHDVTLF